MTVDLNRLREAINDDTVWDTAKAVLDAPTVWWCFKHHDRAAEDDDCGIGQYRQLMGRPDEQCDVSTGVVVPVKGGQE